MSNVQHLTREIRESIITKAVARMSKPRHDAFEAKLPGFADRLYEHEYGEQAPIARAVPRGWISWTETISIQAPGWASEYSKNPHNRRRFKETEHMPCTTLRLSQEQPVPWR